MAALLTPRSKASWEMNFSDLMAKRRASADSTCFVSSGSSNEQIPGCREKLRHRSGWCPVVADHGVGGIECTNFPGLRGDSQNELNARLLNRRAKMIEQEISERRVHETSPASFAFESSHTEEEDQCHRACKLKQNHAASKTGTVSALKPNLKITDSRADEVRKLVTQILGSEATAGETELQKRLAAQRHKLDRALKESAIEGSSKASESEDETPHSKCSDNEKPGSKCLDDLSSIAEEDEMPFSQCSDDGSSKSEEDEMLFSNFSDDFSSKAEEDEKLGSQYSNYFSSPTLSTGSHVASRSSLDELQTEGSPVEASSPDVADDHICKPLSLEVSDDEVKKVMEDGVPFDLEQRVLTRAYFFFIDGISSDQSRNYFEALRIELQLLRAMCSTHTLLCSM